MCDDDLVWRELSFTQIFGILWSLLACQDNEILSFGHNWHFSCFCIDLNWTIMYYASKKNNDFTYSSLKWAIENYPLTVRQGYHFAYIHKQCIASSHHCSDLAPLWCSRGVAFDHSQPQPDVRMKCYHVFMLTYIGV